MSRIGILIVNNPSAKGGLTTLLDLVVARLLIESCTKIDIIYVESSFQSTISQSLFNLISYFTPLSTLKTKYSGVDMLRIGARFKELELLRLIPSLLLYKTLSTYDCIISIVGCPYQALLCLGNLHKTTIYTASLFQEERLKINYNNALSNGDKRRMSCFLLALSPIYIFIEYLMILSCKRIATINSSYAKFLTKIRSLIGHSSAFVLYPCIIAEK